MLCRERGEEEGGNALIWFPERRWNEMQSALKLEQPRKAGVDSPRDDLPSKEEAERLLSESGGGGSCSSSQKPSPSGDLGEGEGPSLHWKDAVAAARSAEGHSSQPLTDSFGYPIPSYPPPTSSWPNHGSASAHAAAIHEQLVTLADEGLIEWCLGPVDELYP
jgi:hypothetical protein